MAKSSQHLDFLPPQASGALVALGEGLAVARLRRKESLRQWAVRMRVSVRTVQRMEKGDPGVGMGVYATALWLVGRSHALAELAAPEHDMAALGLEVQQVKQRGRRATTS
jgi:hypothetical protein